MNSARGNRTSEALAMAWWGTSRNQILMSQSSFIANQPEINHSCKRAANRCTVHISIHNCSRECCSRGGEKGEMVYGGDLEFLASPSWHFYVHCVCQSAREKCHIMCQ